MNILYSEGNLYLDEKNIYRNMNVKKLFGPIINKMDFTYAINNEYICDYRLYIPAIYEENGKDNDEDIRIITDELKELNNTAKPSKFKNEAVNLAIKRYGTFMNDYNGNKQDDILLQEGDVVKIPFCNNLISIKGNVRREGKFEMKEKETFDNLLNFCGGLNDYAYKGGATIISLTDTGRKVVNISKSNFNNYSR